MGPDRLRVRSEGLSPVVSAHRGTILDSVAHYDFALPAARGHFRFEIRSLPRRPAVSTTDRRTRLRDSADDQQSSGCPAPRGFLRDSLPHYSGDEGKQAGGREAGDGTAKGKQHRLGGAGALYAGAFGGFHQAVSAANHQYPSFVLASVRRGEAAPSGVRARSEADRGDGALRHGGAR